MEAQEGGDHQRKLTKIRLIPSKKSGGTDQTLYFYIQQLKTSSAQTLKRETTMLVEKLVKFVNQRPGLDFANYGDISSYRAESREITNDKHDFFELLALAQRRISDFPAKLETELSTTSGRLTYKDGKLEYCTGQYFCTEYRPAANRVLVSLIWNEYRDEKNPDGSPVYESGHAIRKAIRRNLSRRVGRLYFN